MGAMIERQVDRYHYQETLTVYNLKHACISAWMAPTMWSDLSHNNDKGRLI